MMNKSFFGLKPILALFLFLALTCTHLRAAPAAPSNASGWTFFVTITEGEFGMGKSGSFLLCLSGSDFRMISLSNIEDNVGTYTYQASGTDGKVTIGNIVMTFSFTDDRRGNYALVRGGSISGGYQLGKFSAAGGTAPASLSKSVFDLVGKRGDMPSIKLNYRLVTGTGNTYYRVDGGAPSISNTFVPERLNGSTTRVYFNDGILGTGHTHLMFITPTSGLFAFKIGDGKAYEQGSFALQAAAKPEITKQPLDFQVVEEGGRAVFSVSVTGVQPITYQWFQDNAPIPGANQSRYVVNPVPYTEGRAVGYKVRVSNFFGSVESEEGSLLASCATTLDKSYEWFDYTGGTSQVIVTNSGCFVRAEREVSWISAPFIQGTNGFGTMSVTVDPNTNATPRTSSVRIGTQSFKVAQQGTFTPSSLAGKTLRTELDIGTEGFPTNATEIYAMNPGTTNHFFFSTPDGADANKLTYSYRRIDETTAEVNFFEHETILLTFSNFTSGTFSLTNTNSNSSFQGPFILSQRRGDLTYDGNPDLRWQGLDWQAGQFKFRLTDGLNTKLFFTNSVPKIVGVNDFNQDGVMDFVYFTKKRVLIANIGPANTVQFRGGAVVNANWRIVSTEDISGDERPDVLFQHKDGRLAYWEIGGANYFTRAASVRNGRPAATNWLAVSVADMNDDRQADVVLWNQVTRKVAVWYFNNGDFVNVEQFANTNVLGAKWRIRGVADMNSDGHNDLLWQNIQNGLIRTWHLKGIDKVDESSITNPVPNRTWALIGPK